MNATHDRLKSIFLNAAEIASADERHAFLEAECAGDKSLRSEVDELLRHHQSLEGFLEHPAIEVDAGEAASHRNNLIEQPGTIIGPYKLLQQIGEGGFGVVFLTEQERPVKRRVAVKIIKPGMDTREVIARFEAERQALAVMDHPCIAKVYDAGATAHGRPYFVMELVQGVPITEYCDQCNLTTKERLELFITVCQAVQHAHQKGVIHRDIKPTNVLVAIQDGKPSPKIIDFGVAKAINQQLTDRTLMTAYAQIIGTPLYMSPEQAELSPLGVDTRSDIYSLGVLLYELLAGTTPFDKDRLHAASYDELRRIIREEEPPRPSARISTLAANLATTVAEHQRTDVRRLSQQLSGELDWIVMKCLDKDRNRRYESAGSLAHDVERYLHDEPVQACPPSRSYRLLKWMRRNKVAAVAGATVFIVLAVTTAISTWLLLREKDSRRQAEFAAQIADVVNPYVANSPEAIEQAIFTLMPFMEQMNPNNQSRLYFALADLRGRQGRWKESAATFANSIEAQPDQRVFEPWHYYLPALIQSNDLEGYQQARQEAVRRFADSTSPRVAECIVKDCLIKPWHNADFDKLDHLAKIAIQSENHWAIDHFQFAKALLEYRRENYELAQQHLQLAEPELDVLFAIEIYMLQAMLHHRLGAKETAREVLETGARFAEAKMRNETRLFPERLWNDWIIAHALMDEATKLINSIDPPTNVTPIPLDSHD
jgi:serine/threonine protein kinase